MVPTIGGKQVSTQARREAEQGVGEARAGWGGPRNGHIWGSSVVSSHPEVTCSLSSHRLWCSGDLASVHNTFCEDDQGREGKHSKCGTWGDAEFPHQSPWEQHRSLRCRE